MTYKKLCASREKGAPVEIELTRREGRGIKSEFWCNKYTGCEHMNDCEHSPQNHSTKLEDRFSPEFIR